MSAAGVARDLHPAGRQLVDALARLAQREVGGAEAAAGSPRLGRIPAARGCARDLRPRLSPSRARFGAVPGVVPPRN